jgi:hypothetical protein
VRRRWEEENLPADVLRSHIAALDLGRYSLELRGLGKLKIVHQPIERSQTHPVQRTVHGSHLGFSPMTKYPFTWPSAMSATVFRCE